MNKKLTEANQTNMHLNQIRCYDHVCSETYFLFCWIFQFAANFKLYASFQGSVWFPGRYFPGNSISVAALFRQILWTLGAGEGALAGVWVVSSEREMHRKEVAACFKQNRCSCSYCNSKWGGKQDFPHLPSHHLKNMSSRLGLHKIFWVVIETSHWIWEREGEKYAEL